MTDPQHIYALERVIQLLRSFGEKARTPDDPYGGLLYGEDADTLDELLAVMRADHPEQSLGMVAAPPQPCTCPTRDHLDATLAKVINRRATIEQELFDMAAGKLPMPDAVKLRDMAMRLGDPSLMPPPADRWHLQKEGKHPAPCARFCEAQAFGIEIRQLAARLEGRTP